MAEVQKKTSVVILSRPLVVHVDGVEHRLVAGHNRDVPKDVADHWLVKHHAVDAADTSEVEAKANAQIASLEKRLAEEVAARKAAEDKVAELQSVVDAFKATAPKAGK